MDPTIRAKVNHYRDRSDELLRAMQFFVDDSLFRASLIGLLAVHSSIAMNDALTLGVLGKRSSEADHGRAADFLSEACAERHLGDETSRGTARLSWLLSKKTMISYGDSRLDPMLIRRAADKALGFSDWAYKNFKEVLRDSA